MTEPAVEIDDEDALTLDLEGFEGPLHLLLALARTQKVDLAEISVSALADQYIAYIDAAQSLRLEVAADHLVMASWLAFLKSRLLLPKRDADGDESQPPPEELARRLAFRLKRLAAMRDAAKILLARDLEGRDVFNRGLPEGVRDVTKPIWRDELFDLLKAYGVRRSSPKVTKMRVRPPRVYALETAREQLALALPDIDEWRSLKSLLPRRESLGDDPPPDCSVLASAFVAGLELAKDGRAELRQMAAFEDVYLRAPRPAA